MIVCWDERCAKFALRVARRKDLICSKFPSRRARASTSQRALASRGSAALIITGMGQCLGAATVAALAPVMTVESYGLYVFLLSCLNIATAVTQAGLDQLLLKYLPAYTSQSDHSLTAGILQWTTRRVLTITAVATVLAIASLGFWKDALPTGTLMPTLLVVLCVGPSTLALINRSALLAFQKPIKAMLPQAIFTPLGILLGVYVLVFVGNHHADASLVMQTRIVVTLLEVALVTYWVRSQAASSRLRGHNAYDVPIWTRVSRPMFVQSVMKFIQVNSPTALLGILASHRDTGIFGLALRLAYVPLIAITASELICAPVMAELHASRRKDELQRFVWFATGITSAIVIALALVLAVAGRSILHYMGTEYTHAYGLMLILLVGTIVRALCGTADILLMMTEFQRNAAMIMSATLVLALVANCLLVPLYGAFGAAVATALTVVATSLTAAIVVHRRLGVTFLPIPFLEYRIRDGIPDSETGPPMALREMEAE